MSFAGNLSPTEAWERLGQEPKSLLVDVRSEAEWTFVGLPDLGPVGKEPLLLAWQHFPGMQHNAGFVERLSAVVEDKEAPLFFLCRSGARSQAAAIAMTAAGYGNCYNVVEGFEGDPDGEGHRGATNGWKARKLPWRQS
ncbi:MAG: rhodanese-like domain-containing protein [Rhodospirillales bacterium]